MKYLFNWLRMKFEEITKRLTGISCPVFGLQWSPPEAQCAIARRVIRFLEDRRVLYVPYDVEIQEYCTQSVLQIREMLTKELSALDEASGLFQNLKGLRTACRKFMQRTEGEPGRHPRHRSRDPFDIEEQTFFVALGELRATAGIHLACIAAQYGLDVEDDLASILPSADEDKIYPYLSKP